MPDPINLRAARKARDRAEKRATADQNAAKFGRSKAQKVLDQAQTEKSARDLDGHARDSGASADPAASAGLPAGHPPETPPQP